MSYIEWFQKFWFYNYFQKFINLALTLSLISIIHVLYLEVLLMVLFEFALCMKLILTSFGNLDFWAHLVWNDFKNWIFLKQTQPFFYPFVSFFQKCYLCSNKIFVIIFNQWKLEIKSKLKKSKTMFCFYASCLMSIIIKKNRNNWNCKYFEMSSLILLTFIHFENNF